MNNDVRYMKFINWHCGEETNLFGPNMLAQLVERCTGIAEVMVQIPYGPEFFPGPIFNY